MFVHPKQIAQVIERHAEINRARLVVDNQNHVDLMTLHCEVTRFGQLMRLLDTQRFISTMNLFEAIAKLLM